MNLDIWKIAFILQFTALFVLRTFFKIKYASLFNFKGIVKREGLFVVAGRFVLGLPLLAAVFLYIWPVIGLPRLYFVLPGVVRLIGTVCGVFSLIFLVWTHAALGVNFSTTLIIKGRHSLVTRGPYRFIRHPMYSAYCLLFAGAFLISGNWVIGTTGLGIIAMLMTLRRRREEALLRDFYGKAYADYAERAGAFLPRLKRNKTAVMLTGARGRRSLP